MYTLCLKSFTELKRQKLDRGTMLGTVNISSPFRFMPLGVIGHLQICGSDRYNVNWTIFDESEPFTRPWTRSKPSLLLVGARLGA
jgi:hypothetical protein